MSGTQRRIKRLWDRIHATSEIMVLEILRQAAIEAELLEDYRYLAHVEILIETYQDAALAMAEIEY